MITSSFVNSLLGTAYEFSNPFMQMGLSNTSLGDTLTFLDDEKYLAEINGNPNITGCITTANLGERIEGKLVLISDDPRFDYFTTANKVAIDNYITKPTIIHPSSNIHPRAFVADNNVIIGENCYLGPNVTILPDVEIGNGCIIQSGTVIGSEGFEYKRTKRGVLSVFHDGKVIIKNNVHIGANTCIDKGFSFRMTQIENDVKIDNLIHIAHGVSIGKGSFIIAGTVLGGSTIIEDEVWVGINASTAPGITLKSKSFVSMAAVVTRSVEVGQQVTGYFAVDHKKFLENFKKQR